MSAWVQVPQLCFSSFSYWGDIGLGIKEGREVMFLTLIVRQTLSEAADLSSLPVPPRVSLLYTHHFLVPAAASVVQAS